ncbi:MAG: choice-of-anchor D domain-containing protein, partial [Burkholderiaceae bacterium]
MRGKQLYESRFNPNYLSCSDPGSCHGVNPLANMNKVRNGTSGQAILTAVGAVPLMLPLRNLVSQADAADLAAYIANPAAANPTGGLAASSPSLAFGATAVGATNANSNPAMATVSNTSTAAVTISGIAKSGTNAGEFTATGSCVSATPVQLAAGAACTLGATFAPAAAGTRSATLTIQSNASTNPAIALSGTASAVAAATVAVSRNSIAFHTQTISTTSTAQDVVIRNTGTASLTITEVTAAPTPEFSTSSTCMGTLVPGGGCSVVVVFTPSAAGLRSGSVTMTTSSGATTIAVTGNSVLSPTPIVATAESGLMLGSVDVGSAPPMKSISIGNTGNAPLEITAVELRGADARDFAFTSANTCKAGALAPLQE